MSDFLVSHEATIALVAGTGGSIPQVTEVPEVGISKRGRRPVRATPIGQDPVQRILGEKDGQGYFDVYWDMTTISPFPDGIAAVLTVTRNSIGGTTNTITGTVMIHNKREAPIGKSAPPGKQRVRYDWRGVLE